MAFEDRKDELEALARSQGLDFFPVAFEEVPFDFMTEVAAYGLPTRPRHWSYGKVYRSQKLFGEMGLSKIYEIVLNNDPAYAFLLDTNSEIANLLVAAHVFGHADFFKKNVHFGDSDRDMINAGVRHAQRVDTYIERYGLDPVEHWMDIGFALDRHIDWQKGVTRQPYPERRIVEKEHTPQPYEDLFNDPKPMVRYEVEGDKLPPHPERDILWFLRHYAKMEDWQRDVFDIIRAESYYFYPQFMTKIMNEGWASYWHAELFHLYDGVSPDEMIEFAALHAGVVNPGGRFSVNPYYLGYKILVDIEKRWDKMHEEWPEDPRERERLRREKKLYIPDERPPTGREKLFEVRAEDDDISFLRNYLTLQLVKDLGLFAYGSDCTHPPGQKCPHCEDIVLTSRERDQVVEALLQPRYNYGMPRIVVRDVVNQALYLEHLDRATTFLDRRFANQTLAYIVEVWKHPVHILTSDEHGKDVTLTASAS